MTSHHLTHAICTRQVLAHEHPIYVSQESLLPDIILLVLSPVLSFLHMIPFTHASIHRQHDGCVMITCDHVWRAMQMGGGGVV